MTDGITRAVRGIIEIALAVIALGVILQILFPQALVFINADVAGNLIGLITKFSGAGLIGLIAAWLIWTLATRR